MGIRNVESDGLQEGRYLCFEEDCDEQVALRELMDKELFKAPVNDRFPPGQYEKVIGASIQAYHPDYWSFRKTHLLKALENGGNMKKKEDFQCTWETGYVISADGQA